MATTKKGSTSRKSGRTSPKSSAVKKNADKRAAMNKGLTIRQGQTHTHKYMPMLLDKIQNGDIDPSFVITHRVPLSDAPTAYQMFKGRADGCIKVVFTPDEVKEVL